MPYRVIRAAASALKRGYRARSVGRRAASTRKRRSFTGAQTDVKTHKLEGVSSVSNTFTASASAAPVLWNPLKEFYTSTLFTDHVFKMYQQYRIKSVSIKLGFNVASQTAGQLLFAQTLTSNAQLIWGPQVHYVWDR